MFISGRQFSHKKHIKENRWAANRRYNTSLADDLGKEGLHLTPEE